MKPFSQISLALTAAALLSGCVTRGYKLADKSAPPAVTLNLINAPVTPIAPSGTSPSSDTESPPAPPAKPPSPAVTLQTVIVYQGPGSWKREAYWDEYVVAITNRSETPVVVNAAALHDGKHEALAPGEKPWELEKLSKKWWETNTARQTSTYFVLGVGTAVGFGAAWSASWAAFGAGMAGAWGGTAGTVSSGVATTGAIGAAAFVALPLIAGGTVYMNLHRKHQVEAEFTRRRLVLPLTLAPGESAQGSFFFRITPSPQRLVLLCAEGDQTRDATIDLTPLIGLHVDRAPGSLAAPKP